jgi:hypothetical protein
MLGVGCVLSIAFAGAARGDFISTWTVTNNTGVTVSDLHAAFAYTGGITMSMIVSNGGPGAATISHSGNMIDVTWAANYFDDGKTLVFKFASASPAPELLSATWTRTALGLPDIPVDVRRDKFRLVPEPSTWVLLGMGAAVLAVHQRRQVRRLAG